MNWLFDADFGSFLWPKHTPESIKGQPIARVMAAVEQTVETIEPRIRRIPDYAGRLQDAVAHALNYADRVAELVPGVLEVDRRSLGSKARMIFSSSDDLDIACRRSWELKDFLSDSDNQDLAECWAFVCMNKSESTSDTDFPPSQQLGMSFCDHRINTPGRSESEARRALQGCVFQNLLTTAREHVCACRQSSSLLHDGYQRLHSKLKTQWLQHRREGADRRVLLSLQRKMEDLEHRVAAAEEKLLRDECSTPEAWIEKLNEVLGHPEELIRLRPLRLSIPPAGDVWPQQKVADEEFMDLAEIDMGEPQARVVLLARLHRAGVPPLSEPRAGMRLPAAA